MKNYPPALILDLSATGVAVGRILARHGVKVYGADIQDIAIGKFSKYIKRPPFGYKVELNSIFLDELIQFSKKNASKPVLIPSSDSFIEFVGKHFNVLKEHFLMQSSLSPQVSFKFLNKREFYKICDKYDVAYPKTLLLTGEESANDIMKVLRFPIILKPYLIHKWKRYLSGNKVILIKHINELRIILSKEKVLLKDSMLQEVIPGPEENIYLFKGYFDKYGKFLASFTGRKIRQYPPNFGSGSFAESVFNEEVERLSVEFLRKLNFQGICGTEFKYDSRDSIYKMIEINIRPQLWEDLTRVSEREVLWTAYCDLAGLELPKQNDQKNQVRWIYFIRDIFSGLWHVKNSNACFKDWIKSYSSGIKTDALIDFKDWGLIMSLPFYSFSQVYNYKVKPYLSFLSKRG